MAFTVDGERYELDGRRLDPLPHAAPHSWSNPSDEPARAIWLVVRALLRRSCASSSPSAATR